MQAPVRALMAAHGYAAFGSDGVRHTPFSPASGADLPRVFDLLFLPR